MRHVLFAAIAALPLMAGTAFAGNEQEYRADAQPLVSAPAVTETSTDAAYEARPVVVLSISRVATSETGNERPAEFNGMAASSGTSALAQK